MTTYLLLALARPLVKRLPQSLLTVVGILAGLIGYVASPRARSAVAHNLSVVLPNLDAGARRKLTILTFIHGAWGYIELMALSKTSAATLQQAYRMSGWEHLEEARKAGRGVILVGAHLGASTIAGPLVALRGIPTTAVVEPLQPARLWELMGQQRTAFGLKLVAADGQAMRKILEALRGNEIVGILCDRDVAGTGEALPFFGKTARISTAVATLGLRTGAVVLPAVAYRTRPFAAIGRIEAPVELPRSGDAKRDVREGTLRVLDRFERMILERPEQWVLFSEVWPDEE